MVKVTLNDLALSSTDLSGLISKNRFYDTAQNKIREKISEMTKAKHNISFTYRESLRGMMASLNDIGYIAEDGSFVDISVFHGNAERAIAKIKDESNIILPVMSVTQSTSQNDDARRRYESVLVNNSYFDKDKNRYVRVLSLSPRPVNLNYQINVWAKYRHNLDQICEQIRLKFNPVMNVPTPYSTIAKAYLDLENDVGSAVVGDKQDRVLRKSFDIRLETYIPNPKFRVTSTGEIEEIIIDAEVQ